MSRTSRIEWTQATWNPVTGCTKVSIGCKHCYAARMASRLQRAGITRYRNGFEVTLHYELIDLPRKWKEPRMIFVNSMSDLFHETVPVSFIKEVFRVMNECQHHVFQVLTKRSARMMEMAGDVVWSSNIWAGVSVECADYLYRLDHLRAVPAHVRFVSFEPLLGPIEDFRHEGIHWVIVGGESGPGARPISPAWVRQLRDLCAERGIAFFFKQWGGVRKHVNGRTLDGRVYDEYPDSESLLTR